MHNIVIAVITFRRPLSLASTLQSLAKITVPQDTRVRLLIVDNDSQKSALSTVTECKTAIPFPVEYAVEEKPGIPHARNKILEIAAGSDYIAFIDDDDTADSNWLQALYNTARRYSADVVKGRVAYHFPEGKSYLSGIDIFASVAPPTGTDLDSAWTNNVLFSTRIYTDNPLRFDTDFTATGGSDHHFFRCAKKQGAKIVMCNEAVVNTMVPEKRTRWKWITQRNIRVGATLTISDVKARGYGAAFKQVIHSAWESIRYFFRLLPGVFSGHTPAIHPAMVILFIFGRIAGLFHLSPREYK